MSDLDRFVAAQQTSYAPARRELSAGRKRSHWMWYVFPQIAGLGRSATAVRYALGGLDEARAYLAHPVLGPRLVALTGIVNALPGHDPRAVFGTPDDMKFHSSMTLFHHAAPQTAAFRDALDKYFAGQDDRATLERLST